MKMILLGALTLALSACSSNLKNEGREYKPTDPAKASIEAKQLAAESEASDVVEVEFNKGQTQLSVDAQKRIDALIAKANTKGKIDEIKVLVWADREYPSVHTEELSKDQRKLADKRGKEIKNHLKTIADSSDVDVHSMAERPGLLAEWMGTTDARLKRSLEVAGVPNTDTSVKAPAKASRAIVMVLLKQ